MSFLNRIRNFWSFGSRAASKADFLVSAGLQSPALNGMKFGRALFGKESLNPFGLKLQALTELRLRRLLPASLAAHLSDKLIASLGLNLDASSSASLSFQMGGRFEGVTLGLKEVELRSVTAGFGLSANLAAGLAKEGRFFSLVDKASELEKGWKALEKGLVKELVAKLEGSDFVKKAREGFKPVLDGAQQTLEATKLKANETLSQAQTAADKEADEAAKQAAIQQAKEAFEKATKAADAAYETASKASKEFEEALTKAKSGDLAALTSDLRKEISKLVFVKAQDNKEVADEAGINAYPTDAFQAWKSADALADTDATKAKALAEAVEAFGKLSEQVGKSLSADFKKDLEASVAKQLDSLRSASSADWLAAESLVYRLKVGASSWLNYLAGTLTFSLNLKRLGLDRPLVMGLSLLNGMVELTTGAVAYSIRD